MSGDRCPDCTRGNVYEQKEPRVLERIVGQVPLAATVYELERLRCNACGQVFTAQEPEGIGREKYDETAAAMIAQLKYGSGVPFNWLEAQLAEKKTEPNSGLGKAITCLLRHWKGLTAFLREAGARSIIISANVH